MEPGVGEIIKDVLCRESLSRGSPGEPRGEGKAAGLDRRKRRVRHGGKNEKRKIGGGVAWGRAKIPFISIYPLLSTPSCRLLYRSISKAAGAPSSITDKLEGKAEAFLIFFLLFLRWPANVILHTLNGLAVSSTNFRGDNLTFTPSSLHPSFYLTFLPTSISALHLPSLPLSLSSTFSFHIFHQMSSLKSKLKKQSTATGSGVARAFLRAQAALFGSYRDALRYKPVRISSPLSLPVHKHFSFTNSSFLN